MGVRQYVLTRLLRSRSPWVQMAAQPLAPLLTGRLDDVFARADIDWNGHRSCLLLSFDCDFPEDAQALPGIAAELDRHGLRGSFACVGRWVEEYGDAHRRVRDGGHELFNHSYSHPQLVNSPQHFISARDDFNSRRWSDLAVSEQRQEIERCQEAVWCHLRVTMEGFRAPHFGNVDGIALHQTLAAVGLAYSTSVLAARGPQLGMPVDSHGVLEIPVTTCPRHPFTSLDSWHAFYARGGWHRHDFTQLLQERLRRSLACGGLTNIYLDPKDRQRLDFPALFAAMAAMAADCWMPTYGEFCHWWRQHHSASPLRVHVERSGEPERSHP